MFENFIGWVAVIGLITVITMCTIDLSNDTQAIPKFSKGEVVRLKGLGKKGVITYVRCPKRDNPSCYYRVAFPEEETFNEEFLEKEE